MARKKADEGGGTPSWIDTYADMVTLLLTFFVLLFAMSTMNSAKWKMLVSAFQSNGKSNQQIVINGSSSDIGSGVGKKDPTGIAAGLGQDREKTDKVMEFDDLYYYLKGYVEKNNLQGSVQLNKGDGFTFMTFRNSIFFSGNSATLRSEGKQILDVFSDAVKAIPDQIGEIRYYGHTARADDKPTPTTQVFDRQLSVNRANNVLLYMQLKGIIDPKKMVSEGYGEFRPIVPHNGTEANRIKNRRVEIYVSKAGKENTSLDKIYSEISPDSGSSK